jgi:hypothetical protein
MQIQKIPYRGHRDTRYAYQIKSFTPFWMVWNALLVWIAIIYLIYTNV